jgi:hypothetical protein
MSHDPRGAHGAVPTAAATSGVFMIKSNYQTRAGSTGSRAEGGNGAMEKKFWSFKHSYLHVIQTRSSFQNCHSG